MAAFSFGIKLEIYLKPKNIILADGDEARLKSRNRMTVLEAVATAVSNKGPTAVVADY